MKRPAEVYRPSERKYEGTPEDLTYAKMGARRVHGRGYISIQKQRVFLSSALCGWSVGVEPVQGGQINVWFCACPKHQPKKRASPAAACSATLRRLRRGWEGPEPVTEARSSEL